MCLLKHLTTLSTKYHWSSPPVRYTLTEDLQTYLFICLVICAGIRKICVLSAESGTGNGRCAIRFRWSVVIWDWPWQQGDQSVSSTCCVATVYWHYLFPTSCSTFVGLPLWLLLSSTTTNYKILTGSTLANTPYAMSFKRFVFQASKGLKVCG